MTQTAARPTLSATAASGSAAQPDYPGFGGSSIPTVNVGAEKQLQQQAGVQLDLEENYREQRDVDQAEQVVDDFFLAGVPDAQQPEQRTDGFDPRQIVTARAKGMCTRILLVLKKLMKSSF